ncbi:MAG TPA: cytochrome P450 [Stackebrandtia sp.]|jgi:cytochrome P450|uniref:cytochrome P450 n=1 Tax=Stackebrandtia sp. TaxID=2023065 RepID=UPI002D5E934E|nr:cytochrome P450 [Stackebrandtia sp.]HZE40804.1 cytochrome P450 [Stackebrandtia sp.]
MTATPTEAMTATPTEAMTALLTLEGRADPYPIYRHMHTFGPVFSLTDVEDVVVGYDESDAILRHKNARVLDASGLDMLDAALAARNPNPTNDSWRDHSSTRRLSDSMLQTNAPHHSRMRRLTSGAFTARRVTALAPAIARLTESMLDHIADLAEHAPDVDFMDAFAFRLPIAVIGELMGIDETDQLRFRQTVTDLTIALDLIYDTKQLIPADAAMNTLVDYFEDLIDHRRAHPGDDLTSALIAAHDTQGGLSHDELLGNLVLMLVAGFETTTNLLGNGLRLALDHPHHAQQLRDDPDFAAPFVEETLRFDPPVHKTGRYITEDIDLPTGTIHAGRMVHVMIAAANRDARRYPHPDTFDPTRTDTQPLSFGNGPHFCIGSVLARMEATIALPALLRRFPAIALAAEPTFRDRLILRGFDTLPVTV